MPCRGEQIGAAAYSDRNGMDALCSCQTVDAPGRRKSRTAGGTTTQFLSSGSQIWLEAVGGTTTATYTYGNSLIRKDGETPMFDGLGSERTVTNSSQTVTGIITFEGFGATIATTGSSSNPYKFAATSGYRDDGDAGLSHVGARYYDPQTGRFITRDTALDQHPFLYCHHDPVNYVDPSGHDDLPTVWDLLHQKLPIGGSGGGGKTVIIQIGDGPPIKITPPPGGTVVFDPGSGTITIGTGPTPQPKPGGGQQSTVGQIGAIIGIIGTLVGLLKNVGVNIK